MLLVALGDERVIVQTIGPETLGNWSRQGGIPDLAVVIDLSKKQWDTCQKLAG